MIIGLYLLIPILRIWLKNCKESYIIYFFIVCAFVQFMPNEYMPNFDLRYFAGYIGYLVLGYYLTVKPFKNTKRIKIISVCFIILGILVTIFGTYFLTLKNGQFTHYFYDYLRPNILLVATGIFLLFKNLETKFINKPLSIIAKYSYGIYLIHIFVHTKLIYIGIDWCYINPYIGIPLTTLCILVFSTASIALLRLLPFGKYIFG